MGNMFYRPLKNVIDGDGCERYFIFPAFGCVKSVQKSLANTVPLNKRTVNTEPGLEINLCSA